jgi:hypothetical protein
MLIKWFSKSKLLVIMPVLLGMFYFFGYADAGTFSAIGKVTDADGVTNLPGTGLSDLASADPDQPYGYIQCIYAGADGKIDPPNADGTITGDDVLLETAELPGQFFTAVGEGFPFNPLGRFFEDFTHSLNVGAIIYCRAWNGTSPSTSTLHGDTALYELVDANADENDFGTWSTDQQIVSGPMNTVYVDFNYTGEEQGTFDEPFNTLGEAVDAVAVGGEVIIKSGTSPEQMPLTINKQVTIKSSGGSAIIGE